MKTKICVIAMMAGMMSLAAPYQASAEWFQFGPVGAADVVGLNYTVGSNTLLNGEFYAGQYAGTTATSQAGLTTPVLGDTLYSQFSTFCVDLTHEVNNFDQYQVNVYSITDPTNGLANGAKISSLYQTYGETALAPNSTIAVLAPINGHDYDGIGTNDYAAALQVAIWDELANNGHTSGPLTVTGLDATATALVADFLAVASNVNPVSQYVRDIAFPNGKQAFLLPSTTPGITSAPEPATLTLAGLSLACCIPFGLWSRRRPA